MYKCVKIVYVLIFILLWKESSLFLQRKTKFVESYWSHLSHFYTFSVMWMCEHTSFYTFLLLQIVVTLQWNVSVHNTQRNSNKVRQRGKNLCFNVFSVGLLNTSCWGDVLMLLSCLHLKISDFCAPLWQKMYWTGKEISRSKVPQAIRTHPKITCTFFIF